MGQKDNFLETLQHLSALFLYLIIASIWERSPEMCAFCHFPPPLLLYRIPGSSAWLGYSIRVVRDEMACASSGR